MNDYTKGTKYFNTDRFGELFLEEILSYYDIPLFMSLKDKKGNWYLTLCLRLETQHESWMILPISKEKLDRALAGEIETRALFTENENGVWSFDDYQEEKVSIIKDVELIDENLPDKGCFIIAD